MCSCLCLKAVDRDSIYPAPPTLSVEALGMRFVMLVVLAQQTSRWVDLATLKHQASKHRVSDEIEVQMVHQRSDCIRESAAIIIMQHDASKSTVGSCRRPNQLNDLRSDDFGAFPIQETTGGIL